MDIDKYVAYWQDLATHNKNILHTPENPRFARMNIEEIVNATRSDIDMTHNVMILESYEGQLGDNTSDNIIDNQSGAVMVIRHVEKNDFAAENTAQTDSKNILFSLLSKIKKDKETFPQSDANRSNGMVKKFDFNSVSYHKVGPLFDNCYGFRLQFSFSESIDLSYKSGDWTY
jgi:hypothetical protein